MGDLAVALLGIVLANQYALARVPGLRDEPAARAVGPAAAAATCLVLAASAALSVAIRARVLEPRGVPELEFPVLVAVTAALATLGLPVIGRAVPAVGRAFAAAPATMTFNAIALGAALRATRAPGSLAAVAGWSIGAGAGFALLSACFAELRGRVDAGEIPAAVRGVAVALASAGIIGLGLGGLAGLVRG